MSTKFRTPPSTNTRNINRELEHARRQMNAAIRRAIGRFHTDHRHRGSLATCALCRAEMQRRQEIIMVPTVETAEAAE